MKYKDMAGAAKQNNKYGNPAKGQVMKNDRQPSALATMPMNEYKKGRCPNRGYDGKAYDYSY